MLNEKNALDRVEDRYAGPIHRPQLYFYAKATGLAFVRLDCFAGVPNPQVRVQRIGGCFG
jgi:hypothetical protein